MFPYRERQIMRALLAILLAGFCVGLSSAGEPLPEPRPESPPLPFVEISGWGRVNRYAIWQNYAVDRYGYFRPRVIYTTEGAFYYYDGRPYPYLITHPLDFMPHASN
jgi:hypothetical protein